MNSETFLVSVFWQSARSPAVGYSRYNRPCDENWTDYGDGFGWVLNTRARLFPSAGNDCNHPMFRRNVEHVGRKGFLRAKLTIATVARTC